MKTALFLTARVLGGILAVATIATPQAYTISARPGAVNYVEGNVSLDGQPVGSHSLKDTFLNAGGLLETQDGKAEVLLTPGVFLRVGDNSRVRMLKPSLIDTQLAIEAGESMIEVDQFVRDSRLTVSVNGGMTEIEKTGLYRFSADGVATVAVIDGKASVTLNEKHTNLNKGHEVDLSDNLKSKNIDKDREDELLAWSNVRSQYNASLTYQAAKSAYSNNGGGSYGGYNSGFYGQGWFWSNGFNSWLWMPGGEFYSPFGWGFYGPGYAYGAPVIYVPVNGGGSGGTVTTVGGKPVRPPIHPKPPTAVTVARGGSLTVPVNPRHMPAIGAFRSSPSGFEAARVQSARTISQAGGLQTGSGLPVSRSGRVMGSNGNVGAYHGGGGQARGGGQSRGAAPAAGGGGSHSNGGGSFGGGGGGAHAGGGGGAPSGGSAGGGSHKQ